MKQFILKNKKSVAGIAACLLIGIVTLSFQDSPFVHSMLEKSCQAEDTTKPLKKKNSMTMKEFDRLSENLDKEVLDQIKEINVEKIQEEVLASIKEVDVEKIMKEVEASLKDIDTEKILAEVKAELDNIDFKEISRTTELALTDANKEIEKALAEVGKIDKEAIRKELENAKEELEKSRVEVDKIDLKNIMAEAKEGIDKAKVELKQIKTMFTEMEKDGLVNSKKGFKLEYRDNDLFINGKKQATPVTDKYRKYFKEDHFEITIDPE